MLRARGCGRGCSREQDGQGPAHARQQPNTQASVSLEARREENSPLGRQLQTDTVTLRFPLSLRA